MVSKFETQSMSRRAFGRFAALSVGAGIALTQVSNGFARSRKADQARFNIYAFYPKEEGVMTNCKACRSHAAYKRFATAEAAKASRAHAGCKCALLMIPVSKEHYTRMFGGSGQTVDRTIFDIRWPLET